MSFTKKKFSELSILNRTKKLAFAIREFLAGKESAAYIENLFCWHNALLSIAQKEIQPQTRTEWQHLCQKLLQQLGEDYDYIDSQLFDAEISSPGKGVLILDNLRAPYNVGGILRSAEAFHAAQVALCGITPGLENVKVQRTSMKVPIKTVRFATSQEAVIHYRSLGFCIISIEKCNTSQNILQTNTLPLIEKRALILGNEEFGIEQELLETSDFIFHIPLSGTKNSLNVCTAAGIAMFALFSQELK